MSTGAIPYVLCCINHYKGRWRGEGRNRESEEKRRGREIEKKRGGRKRGRERQGKQRVVGREKKVVERRG